MFRDKISQMLVFQKQHPSPMADTTKINSTTTPTISIPDKPTISVKKPPTVPTYSGRDPTELRPVTEEVKLFTEGQKEELFATLQTHGRAVKADPKYFNGWIQVGILKKTIGDFEGARDAWEYAGVIQPLNSTSFSNLGELFWKYLHDYPKAEKSFRTSLKNKPYDPFTYVSLAELYHYSYQEKSELADDVLLEGIKANPEGSPYEMIARRLARLYEERGKKDQALEWWKKVLLISPNDEDLKKEISRLELP